MSLPQRIIGREIERLGESLSPASPVVSHYRVARAAKSFMITSKITHQIRQAMRKAGVFKRPYVPLEVYAETQLIIAESKGDISHPYLQFVAGHKGDIEVRYSTNKGRLPPQMIQDIRVSFKKSEQVPSDNANTNERGE